MGRQVKQELVFLCLGCGKTATLPVSRARVPMGVVRYHFLPIGWAMLYPPADYPARSGICAECLFRHMIV